MQCNVDTVQVYILLFVIPSALVQFCLCSFPLGAVQFGRHVVLVHFSAVVT